MAATLNLQKECAKVGLKPVFGYTFTMVHNETKVEIKIYALSNKGLHNLLNIQREVMVNSEDSVIEYSRLFLYAEGCAIVFATHSAYWMTENQRNVERMKERFDAVYYQVDGNEYKADRIDREKLAALKHYFDNCYDAVNDSFIQNSEEQVIPYPIELFY
jgi:DNA polymerase-3 subunit alpha